MYLNQMLSVLLLMQKLTVNKLLQKQSKYGNKLIVIHCFYGLRVFMYTESDSIERLSFDDNRLYNFKIILKWLIYRIYCLT